MKLQIPSLAEQETKISGNTSAQSSQSQTQQTTLVSTVKSSLIDTTPSYTTKRESSRASEIIEL